MIGLLCLLIFGKTCVTAGMGIQIQRQLLHNETCFIYSLKGFAFTVVQHTHTSPKGRSSWGKSVPRHRAREGA